MYSVLLIVVTFAFVAIAYIQLTYVCTYEGMYVASRENSSYIPSKKHMFLFVNVHETC